MSFIVFFLGIALLLTLIMGLRFNAFIVLIVVAIFVGLGEGMNAIQVQKSIQKGVGDTLGSLVLVLGFGVMFGKLLSETGAIQKISEGMISFFGAKHIKTAMIVTGFIVGMAMFYNAGFVILIPLVFTISYQSKLPLLYIGISMAAALSVTHGFLPPHPGPTSIAVLFNANIGKVLLYGILIAIPAIFLAGFIFPSFLKNIIANPPEGIISSKHATNSHYNSAPSFVNAFLIALIPILLMAVATVFDFVEMDNHYLKTIIKFLGEPGIALLIAILAGLLTLRKKNTIKTLMDKMGESVGSVAMILLIIGAGGAFKQVLIDSGLGNSLGIALSDTQLSPLVLGWLIALSIRIAIGSATVAGLTAAGIMQPMLGTLQVNPELMVLSIGAGSLMCSHVNDTGFWMFKEYFGLSLADTFKSWTAMETIVGLAGLAGVLLLNTFI